jgi:hypothetical protein
MSGGSFNYAYSEMRDGQLDKFQHAAKRFIEALQKLEDGIRSGAYTLTNYKSTDLDLTEIERTAAADAVKDAREAFLSLEQVLRLLQLAVPSVADVAHAIEWWVSGDSLPEDVVRACLEFRRKRQE